MTPEEVDQLARICHDACLTETGKRLYAAIITDGLFEDILRGYPNPADIAAELGNKKIAQIARQELESLTDDEKEQLADYAADHLRRLVVGAGKGAFKAMKNGILDSDDLTPDFLINVAAVACVAQATK